MTTGTWPLLLDYDQWRATCDTLHANTQVLGKLAAALAPRSPHYQHLALRLSARGWETRPLPAPDGSGALVVALDLHVHEALVEPSGRPTMRVPLTPHRPVGAVTRGLLAAVRVAAGPVTIDPTPQEVGWTVPLDEDDEHATYDPEQVRDYFAAATRAALVLAELRAPYRGRATPVNAWWGSFDLALSLFADPPADPSSEDGTRSSADGGPRSSTDAGTPRSTRAQEVAVGWWPGDALYGRPAFYAYTSPALDGFPEARLSPEHTRWDPDLGEYLLDWADLATVPDPHAAAVAFGRSAVRAAGVSC